MNLTIDNEFRALIPALTAEEYAGLEKSILAEGCRDALVVWNGTLIDGHNRYEICQRHNIGFQTVQKDFDSREAAHDWIIDNQCSRRNLPKAMQISLQLKKSAYLIEQAKENHGRNGGDKKTAYRISDAPIPKISVNKNVAATVKCNADTVSKVRQVEAKATPEVKQAMLSGEISINQAYQATRREEKRQETQQRIDDYAKVQTGVVDIAAPKKKYNIIYADPPWKHDAWVAGNKAPNLHYPTMTTEEISALPISELADNDCALFLWATYPHLPEALQVIKAWGFDYSTAAFVWVKKNKTADTPFFGCGAWTRANSEICLLATRGHVQRLDASISQIIEAPIEEHSKKPDIVRELIERLVGKLPRIELFCRHPAAGWDIWGNEA